MAGLRTISFLNPTKLVCGCGATDQCAIDVAAGGFRKALVMTASAILGQRDALVAKLREQGIDVVFSTEIDCEPTLAMFEALLRAGSPAAPNVIIGLGGGSVLDVAKLVAALLNARQGIREVLGINLLRVANRSPAFLLKNSFGAPAGCSPSAPRRTKVNENNEGAPSPARSQAEARLGGTEVRCR